MPYQAFSVVRVANERGLEERLRKEYHKTEDKDLGRVRSLFKDGFRLQLELHTGRASE